MKASRRQLLRGAASALLLGAAFPRRASALGRLPFGGRLRLSIPWALESMDPHELTDPVAALFAPEVFDSLYALDDKGRPYPALAAALPVKVAQGVGVRLRPELITSRGQRLHPADLEFSLRRSASSGAYALLHSFGVPSRDRQDRALVVFPQGSPEALARALSSPLTAIVRIGFKATSPEGTGAFAAKFDGASSLMLSRNERAARGPALLSSVEVGAANDLAEPLRRFEAHDVDLGWLGRGLHRSRPDSSMFEGPLLGWLVLHTGQRLGAWGAPGAAQRLLQSIEPAQLSRFGLQPPRIAAKGVRYGGPRCELLTRADSPYLMALARVIAQLLGQPGSEIAVRGETPRALHQKVESGDMHFALDLVRTLGPTREQQQLALLTTANRRLAAAPPRLPAQLHGDELALFATQATRTGVVAAFRVVAAKTSGYAGIEQWSLGNVWLR